MKKGKILNGLAVMGTSGLLLSSSGICAEEASNPNILFLFADDQSYETLSTFGSEVQTPNLDRLVANGVTFTNAYNQGAWCQAVCLASRAMFNTGRFMWHAMEANKKLNQEVENGRLWPQYLNNAGYDTYMSGKWHVNTPAPGIFKTVANVRGGMPNQTKAGYNRPKNEEDYKNGWKPWDKKNEGYWKGGKHWSEVLGDDSIKFIEQSQKSDKPFFMYLAFNAPHDPRQSPKEYVDKYPLEKIKVPENFLPEYPYKDKIGCSCKSRKTGRIEPVRDERLAPFPRTEYAVKVNRQEYYAIITHMDTQIGRILDALEKSGKMDNTYIFFTADHGLAVGHHGLIGKQNMFEHSMKAPLIVNGPNIPKGKKIDTPVYIQDIMPTTLELAGVDKPKQVQFKSLLPLISGDAKKSYDAVYGGYKKFQRMVRKGEFKLIYYPKIKKTLLFDLKNDPNEMHDLFENPKYKSTIEDLFNTLHSLQKEVGDTIKN